MTNEEFAALKPADTEFIEIVTRAFTTFYVSLKDKAFIRFRETPLGDYLWKVNNIISEINQNTTDIKLAENFLMDFEPDNMPLKKDSNAAQIIRYHYENYLLRTTKISDLSLALINQVMRLELKKGSNMEARLIKSLDPTYGQFDVIWGHMKQLTDHVKPYRNHLAHNGTVKHKDLALLDAHYTYGIAHIHKSIVDEFRYEAAMTGVQRELIEKFTAQTKAYLVASDQVLKMVYLYLAKPFVDSMEVLLDQHKP